MGHFLLDCFITILWLCWLIKYITWIYYCVQNVIEELASIKLVISCNVFAILHSWDKKMWEGSRYQFWDLDNKQGYEVLGASKFIPILKLYLGKIPWVDVIAYYFTLIITSHRSVSVFYSSMHPLPCYCCSCDTFLLERLLKKKVVYPLLKNPFHIMVENAIVLLHNDIIVTTTSIMILL